MLPHRQLQTSDAKAQDRRASQSGKTRAALSNFLRMTPRPPLLVTLRAYKLRKQRTALWNFKKAAKIQAFAGCYHSIFDEQRLCWPSRRVFPSARGKQE